MYDGQAPSVSCCTAELRHAEVIELLWNRCRRRLNLERFLGQDLKGLWSLQGDIMLDFLRTPNALAGKVLVLLILLACRSSLLRSDGLIPPLTQAQTEQARKTLSEFKTNPKGPYLQIRWFCKDGSVHPPQGTPCQAHGGGSQYAELSPSAHQLAKWNLDAGVILAGLDFER